MFCQVQKQSRSKDTESDADWQDRGAKSVKGQIDLGRRGLEGCSH